MPANPESAIPAELPVHHGCETAPHFHAGYNQPGYLPESEPATFATFDEAKAWLLWELNFHADNVFSWGEPHVCDDVPCPTYGDDCKYDQANSLSNTAEDLNLVNGPEWGDTVAGMAYWISECVEADCGPDDDEAVPVRQGSHDPIAYTYEADHHCPACTAQRFGTDSEGFIPADSEDSEGNGVGAVFQWDEWWNAGTECETLACGDCGTGLDTAHADPHSSDCPEWEPPETDDDDCATCGQPHDQADTGYMPNHLAEPCGDFRTTLNPDYPECCGNCGWAHIGLAPKVAPTTSGNPWPKTPSMSRADFAYLAAVLARLDFVADDGRRGGGTVHQYVVEHFAYHLADTNPRFNRDRFIAAASGR